MFTWVCLGFDKVLDILIDVGYFQVVWAMAIGCFSKMFGPFHKGLYYWVSLMLTHMFGLKEWA